MNTIEVTRGDAITALRAIRIQIRELDAWFRGENSADVPAGLRKVMADSLVEMQAAEAAFDAKLMGKV